MRTRGFAGQLYLTIIQVMTMIIPLADAKARLSAVLDDVRDTHDRVVITRNGRPEAVIISVSDLETIEETLDLLSTPGAIDEIRTAEAEIARGEAIGADELRRLMAERVRNERNVVHPGAAADLAIELAASVANHANARVPNVFS